MNSKRIIAQQRSNFYQAIRIFFNQLDYVEIETPILSPSLIPESAIEVFETVRHQASGAQELLYLTPSPEIYMKTLIREGIGDCYQLTKAFRNCEDQGRRHRHEFTLLEWYGMSINYKDNIALTQGLLMHLAELAAPETRPLFTEFTEATMDQLFLDYVNIDLQASQTLASFKSNACNAGFEEYAMVAQNWEELFHFIFVAHIENKLPQDKTVFITNYPAQILTTAQKNNTYYERWEFYMQGWEIANCYTEATSYTEMLALFKKEEAAKQRAKVRHLVDYEYLTIFKENNFPPCSGVALGVDRLLAIACNAPSLSDVTLF